MPVPFVWIPNANEPPMIDLAAYGEIDDRPGSYELEWFSRWDIAPPNPGWLEGYGWL